MTSCPLCNSSSLKPVSSRFLLCPHCRSIINSEYLQDTYSSDYFLSEYKNHYGKTYEDDFDGIYHSSCKRLDVITSLVPLSSLKSLLEIGSALGFFLKCAHDRGIEDVEGIEISGYAAEWSVENYGFQVSNVSFHDYTSEKTFDVVAAWYVLEHFPHPGQIFNKIFSLLSPGGILAFSMPGYFGPSFYFSRETWEENFPGDHILEVHPRGIKRYLKSIGFRKVYIRSSGFHPERIVSEESFFYPVFSILYRLFTKVVPFSDTFEVYGVK